MTEHTNRLADETSPYLRQHAHNPVDWFPWGTRALRLARLQDKPILLSVGYSACHWCHVMARESFEDEATAAMMNRYFVNIKVDREERPDVDEIYMKAVQSFTNGRGGWPMTVFLTPDGQPFYGGTYFPPQPRAGLQAFRQVLAHVHMLWTHNRPEVAATTARIQGYLDQTGQIPRAAHAPQSGWLARVADAAHQDFDERHGGFGYAPKFPPHGTLSALLVHHWLTDDVGALRLVTRTLDAMARGGMYDLLAGGFARYSVDDAWRVPHFEKMLYDNALLAPIYVDAFQVTGAPAFKRVATQTLDWVLREMTHPQGGFCASQDADSEGVEGRYFVWTPAQLDQVLGEDGPRAAELLQVTPDGSFERGASVLRLETPLFDLPEADRALLQVALPKLLAARAERVPPGRDDKVLTAWNALMISALARAGAALADDRYTQAATRAARFLLDSLRHQGRLLRTWRGGQAHLLAYADDHAYLVQALIDLHQLTQEQPWLDEALRLADQTVQLFWDDEDGGLFYTGSDADALVIRSKNFFGGALPSANGVAALGFARLATLCGRDDLGQKADRILLSFQPLLDQAPRLLGVEAIARAWRSGLGRELAIMGPSPQAMLELVHARHEPLLALAVNASPQAMPWLQGKTPAADQTTAWLCQGFTCQEPTTDPAALERQLDGHGTAPSGPDREPAPDLPQDPALWLNTPAPLSMEALRGQVVVIDFWTQGRVSCDHVHSELAAVQEHFAGQPVVFIGVHSPKFPAEHSADSVRAAIQQRGLAHPIVLDPDHALWQRYTVATWPTVVIIDTRGGIAWGQPGEVDRDKLTGTIDRLLAEQREPASPIDWRPPAPAPTDTPLAFPGKVRVYPGAAQQQSGADALADGWLYIADTGHHRVIEARLGKDADGWPLARVHRVFGDGQPGFTEQRLDLPQGMDRTGRTLWVADTGNHAVRAVDLDTGLIRTIAGTGTVAMSAELAPGPQALRSPWDVVAAGTEAGFADQNLVFIAMAGNHQLWVAMPEADRIGPMVGSGREDHSDGPPPDAALAQPSGMELFGPYLFFVDAETSSVRVFDMNEQKVSTLVGKGLFDFGDVDGNGEDARLQHPLALTASGKLLWVADTYNDVIRAVDMNSRQTRTVGGRGQLSRPGGITVAGAFLIIADTHHHRLAVMRQDTGELRELALDWGPAPAGEA